MRPRTQRLCTLSSERDSLTKRTAQQYNAGPSTSWIAAHGGREFVRQPDIVLVTKGGVVDVNVDRSQKGHEAPGSTQVGANGEPVVATCP